jgi:hypothetical protein
MHGNPFQQSSQLDLWWRTNATVPNCVATEQVYPGFNLLLNSNYAEAEQGEP